MEQYMWIVWLGIFVVALIVEASTTEIVSIFFAFGSLIAMIIAFIPNVSWWIQLIVFVVISGVSLFALRPLISKVVNKQKRNTNIDEYIGRKTVVIDINEAGYPEVKVNGLIWRVEGLDETEKYQIGDKVIISEIKGNRLIVKKENK